MNPFTDDDLKRWKAIPYNFTNESEKLEALITRMEAAEQVIHQLTGLNSDPFQDGPVIEAWRKAARK